MASTTQNLIIKAVHFSRQFPSLPEYAVASLISDYANYKANSMKRYKCIPPKTEGLQTPTELVEILEKAMRNQCEPHGYKMSFHYFGRGQVKVFVMIDSEQAIEIPN